MLMLFVCRRLMSQKGVNIFSWIRITFNFLVNDGLCLFPVGDSQTVNPHDLLIYLFMRFMVFFPSSLEFIFI